MIRSAKVDDLPELIDLMHRSKAHWGYDENFMTAARAVLQLTPNDVQDGRIAVFDMATGPLGLCKLVIDETHAELDKLFVAPEAMGKGVGRALMRWAISTARAAGAIRLQIEADPDAVPFYERMGARQIGRVPSEAIAGRWLALLEIDLSDLAPGLERSI